MCPPNLNIPATPVERELKTDKILAGIRQVDSVLESLEGLRNQILGHPVGKAEKKTDKPPSVSIAEIIQQFPSFLETVSFRIETVVGEIREALI